MVRFAVQKQRFQIDDALIILAAALNVATTVVLYDRVVEFMYLIEAIQYEIPGVQPPSNIVSLAETFQIALMVCWTSISTVKVFFLLFFWRLIDRLRSWKIYWWFVLILNVLIIIFGMTVYWISCPYWGRKACELLLTQDNISRQLTEGFELVSCANGSGQNPLVRYSAAQISLDILGDVLSML